MTRYKIVPVELPGDGVRAAAVEERNGSFTIYVNTRLPEDDRKAAVDEMTRKIRKEERKHG